MSSNEILPEKGMYLVKPHGNLVWTGKKTLIVKEKEFPNMLNIPLYLIEGKLCYGILELTSMRKIWKVEFENRRKEHLITPEEIKAWGWIFPLFAYEYKFLENYKVPRGVEIPQGVQTFVDSKNIEFLISDQDLEAKHLLAHTLCNLDLHLLVHAELRRRGKEHQDLDELDREEVILLEDIAKYDPAPLTDQVLVNDHRLAHIFANRMREGIKIESKQWSPFALPEQKKMIEHIHSLIVAEMEKRKMKHLTPLAVNITDITADYCKGLGDEELKALDAFLHKTGKDSGVNEDLVNAAIFVEEELRKRGIKIPDWKDDLEKQMQIFIVEYPSPEGLQEEITLDKVVGSFPDTLPSDFPPIPIFLIGRIVNEGKIPSNHDIDILIKGPYLEGLVYFIKNVCTDPAIARRLHVTFDLRGPMIGYSYPLYSYDYKKSTINKRLSPWEILAELKPLTYHKNQKPEKETEVWDADVLWREWAEERIAHKLHVQKKYDGMYFQIHRKGDEVRFFTEDSHIDRQDAFKKSREELLKISGTYIIHAEMVEYDNEGKALKREEMIKWINAKPESLDDKNVVFHVHDVTYLNEEQLVDKGYGERYRALQSLISGSLKHFEAIPSVIVENKQEFFKAVEDVRTMPGSEGAMVKDSTGVYKTQCAQSSCRTNDMAKVKNLKEIDVIVLKRVPKKTAEGKEMDQYTYECGIQIPASMKDEFKRVEEINGNYYAYIGESYSTSLRLERGEILVVRPVQVLEYIEEEG